MSMEIFAASPSHVSTKYTVLITNYHVTLWKFLSGTHLHQSPHGHKLDGDELVNAPLSCYNVKWRNIKVAITGLVQLSNLISSYNGNTK